MTAPTTTLTTRVAPATRRAVGAAWTGFAAVHLLLAYVGVEVMPGRTFWDVDLYRSWMAMGLLSGQWPLSDGPWVYPAGAAVPMLAASLGGTTSTVSYAIAWSVVITVMNAAAVVMLLRHPWGVRGVWWWLAFLLLMGPVGIGRLDAVIVPMLLAALLVALRQPRIAAALLTAGAWVKVAPGIVLLPLLMMARRSWRGIVGAAVAVTAAVVAITAAVGGLPEVLSFLTAQNGRGLQIESVAATPFIIASRYDPSVVLGFNYDIITWEVTGGATAAVASFMGVLLPLAAVAAAALLWFLRPGTDQAPAVLQQYVTRAAMLLMALLIVTNKVGSPQYVVWLAAPVAVALGVGLPRWRATAILTLVIAGLTQLVYPFHYGQITGATIPGLLLLTTRNLALVALLVLVTVELVKDSRRQPYPS